MRFSLVNVGSREAILGHLGNSDLLTKANKGEIGGSCESTEFGSYHEGHFVHEAVIAAGEKESGITIHYVDEYFEYS